MSKKWFCISDIHGFYSEMVEALNLAGFDKKNKDHILIIVGDILDRGPEAVKTYEFIQSIPKKRRVLIKGNHEDLYQELLDKSWPEHHDYSNKTVDTFCQIAGIEQYKLHGDSAYWDKIKDAVRESPITKFINSKEWRDYYELGPFVFTHSFVPVKLKPQFEAAARVYGDFDLPEHCFEPKLDWRKSNRWEWYKARWGAPHRKFFYGLFAEDKTLVVGHWHTGDFFEYLKNDTRYAYDVAPIYFSKRLIGLDGGCYTANHGISYIHPQNVLVIDEDWKCYDKYGKLLEEEPAVPVIETVQAKDLDIEEK